jgi:hypothetical protein
MKKIALLTLLILATVLVTLAVSAAAAPKAPTPVFAAPAVPAAALPEEHPHIHAALESMRGAKHELESAAHDFEGHRIESIKHLDMAIHEAEICERMK